MRVSAYSTTPRQVVVLRYSPLSFGRETSFADSVNTCASRLSEPVELRIPTDMQVRSAMAQA